MILTDDMLALAFQYSDTELSYKLTDSDENALRISDAEPCNCSV